FGQTNVPPGQFADLSAGDTFSCGLGSGGLVTCWGDSSGGRTAHPPLAFASLDAGGSYACGVTAAGAPACWGVPLGGLPFPNDADVDSIGDGVDNCGVTPNFDQANLDSDSAGDVCDLCPSTASTDQRDFDLDGVGDTCDNCPRVPNPGQEDSDNDGQGDACVPTEVSVRRAAPGFAGFRAAVGEGISAAASGSSEDFDVYVSCGTSAIRRVELGVVLPQGSDTSSVSFGPGCTPTTCSAAQGLGATVNAALSRASGPGLTTPGTRSDAVYFSLVGAGPPDGRLCGPFEELRMATIRSNTPPAGSPVPTLSTEGLAPLNLTPLTDTTNRVLAPAEYAFLALDSTPNVQLGLSPALGDTTGHKWQIDLLANLELNNVVLGLVAPAGTTTAQMRFTGCSTLSGSPATRRV
ncbi:MAG: thrombospondin type 3 repeat-containing protein, partial [Solirubrobacteraceae bacterium]